MNLATVPEIVKVVPLTDAVTPDGKPVTLASLKLPFLVTFEPILHHFF